MDAPTRRGHILQLLNGSNTPLSATALGETLGVSRQIVVGDVALLRAENHPILSTNRGYLLATAPTRPRRVFHVRHHKSQTAQELQLMVHHGGTVLNTVIEHPTYGAITVDLMLSNSAEVEAFMERFKDARALMDLTDGRHFHTVEAESEEQLDAIEKGLAHLGFLMADN